MLKWVKENKDLLFAIVWVILVVPSLIWWKNSVLLVIILSIYANYETSISAWHARKAEHAKK